MRAGPCDNFGEVRVAGPGAELGEVSLEGSGALVLLCGPRWGGQQGQGLRVSTRPCSQLDRSVLGLRVGSPPLRCGKDPR